jgi:DNA-directed RNA polymerase specialized sigma24 family protein
MSSDTLPPAGAPAQFQTTRWSLILRARGEGALARAALEGLCRAYWFPLYAFARRNGAARQDAEDLTQAFFSHVWAGNFVARAEPAKGRFRSFLLGSLRNFIAKEHARDSAQKRGGGVRPVDFDETVAEQRLSTVGGRAELTPLPPLLARAGVGLAEELLLQARVRQLADDPSRRPLAERG